MPELKLDARACQIVVSQTGRLLATFAILQGLNIIAGGPQRWAGQSFSVALMLPGAPPTWGVILTVLGAVGLIGSLRGRYRPVYFSMYGSAIWCVFFAAGFGLAAITTPTAATTGVWAYGTLAVLYVLIGVVYRESRKTRL